VNEHKNTLFYFLTSSRFHIWRHLIFMLVLLPIALSQSFFTFGSIGMASVSTIYIFGIGFWGVLVALVYVNLSYLTPQFLLRYRYLRYCVSLFAMIFAVVSIKYFVESWTANTPRHANLITILDWLSNSTLYVICISSSSITALIRTWLKDNQHIRELENKRIKKDIEEFKSRIDPQLLYATLSDTAAKVTADPEAASDTLFRLSEVLRYQLYDCNRDKGLLESEIAFVKNYIKLQQLSADKVCHYSIAVKGKVIGFVPPALFKSLAEIIIAQHPTAFEMSLRADGQSIVCSCKLSGITDPSVYDFSPIEQRLRLLGISYQLSILPYHITLKLC